MSAAPDAPSPYPTPEPSVRPRHRFTMQRVYPALIFTPLFYAMVRYLPPTALLVVVTVAALLAVHEFNILYFSPPLSAAERLGQAGLLVSLLLTLQYVALPVLVGTMTAVCLGLLLLAMCVTSNVHRMLPRPGGLVFGAAYLGLGLGHVVLLRQMESGELLIFFVILVTWAADIGAYYVGASVGRIPIAPRLSPKKTVEGFLAGAGASVAAAIGIHFWFLPDLPLLESAVLGMLLAGMGLLGDLAESTFKRQAHVKDSGSLIPGHGGVFDRIDSLLFTAPTVYYYLLLTG